VSTLVVGLSYRTAPIALLERAALSGRACRALEGELCRSDHVAEAVVLSTCNRLEVYAEVSKFHGGVADVSACLAGATGLALAELTDHLYVHYEVAAVAHLFAVAAGLDSMAVGEQQILGQVRVALRGAQESGAVDGSLGVALQQALRVGKRVHSETGLDRAGHSLVEAGLAEAGRHLAGPLERARALVVGAGAMSGLAVATLQRAGVRDVAVLNRTFERAERLAQSVGGRAVQLAELPQALAEADLVLSCTGAVGHVVGLGLARDAARQRAGRPQVYVDLALPRDVDPAIGDLDGVRIVDLEALGHVLAGEAIGVEIAEAKAMVAAEVNGYLAAQRAAAVAPTVVALRALARSVVEAELDRLRGRLGAAADAGVVAELEQTVHRVVEKLLHTPTVRVKELAGEPGGSSYADALRELFGLDQGRVAAVSDPVVGGQNVIAGQNVLTTTNVVTNSSGGVL
jgi:glutamyl-tRNA reductase